MQLGSSRELLGAWCGQERLNISFPELRISEIHEHPAAGPKSARRALVDHHDWPADTVLEQYVAFGATS